MIIFDILRIVAALMVFTIHLFIFVPGLPESLCDVLSNGSYGVSIFFVMSGFLIFSSLERSRSLKEYYIKRISRILPAYYAILIVGILFWGAVWKQMPPDTYAHMGWLRYFLCLNTWLPSNDYGYWNNLWGLWTISCFAFFYLIAPLLKKVIRSFKRAAVFMVAMIPATVLLSKVLEILFTKMGASQPQMLCVDNPLYSLNTFAMGICAWYAYREGKVNTFLRVAALLLAGFMGLNWFNRVSWGMLTALVMMIFIDLKINSPRIVSVIKVAGRYSFCLYLVHLCVIEIIDHYNITGTTYLIFAVLFSVLAAVFLYHCVEKPCSALLKKRIAQ
ncbi:MAG: acyltransferase [Alistipes sp.]|nr:acyltransferase [Alistipes sp.]